MNRWMIYVRHQSLYQRWNPWWKLTWKRIVFGRRVVIPGIFCGLSVVWIWLDSCFNTFLLQSTFFFPFYYFYYHQICFSVSILYYSLEFFINVAFSSEFDGIPFHQLFVWWRILRFSRFGLISLFNGIRLCFTCPYLRKFNIPMEFHSIQILPSKRVTHYNSSRFQFIWKHSANQTQQKASFLNFRSLYCL